MIEKHSGGFSINRTEFFERVKNDFSEYADKLADPAENVLRKNFIAKMNKVAGV